MRTKLAADSVADHWDERYRTVGVEQVSWFEERPALSLGLLTLAGVGPSASVLDVGGGASGLADVLVAVGHGDVGVLDVSGAALDESRRRSSAPDSVRRIRADLLAWEPDRLWGVWHDRAAFHFLVEPGDRAAYRDRMARAVTPGGVAVVIGFAEDGPTACSGLEVHRTTPEQLLVDATPGFAEVASGHAVHVTPTGAIQRLSFVVARAPG